MTVVSALPQRLDIQAMLGESLSFGVVIGQNITGQSVSATMFAYRSTGGSIFSEPRSLSVAVTNPATGAVTVSLSSSDTIAAQSRSGGVEEGCLPHWVLQVGGKTYFAGTVSAGIVTGCNVNQLSNNSSGGVFL